MRKCLAKDPDERWQTAKDLGDELRWVLQSGTSAIVPNADAQRETSTAAPGRDKVGRRRRFIFRITIGISLSALITTGLLVRLKLARSETSISSTKERPAPREASPGEPSPPTVASNEVQVALDNAQALFLRKSYDGARSKAQQVLLIDPDNRQARELLLKLNTANPSLSVAADVRSVSADATLLLEKLYQQEVVSQCRVRVDGRYPFGTAGDMPLADFAEVFGHGGLYDRFFTARLSKLVDTSQRPWAWRSASVAPSPGMLAQFERAERIRQMFFSPGSKMPELGFNVRLSNLDAASARFYVYIDGQRFDLKSGADNRGPVVWPGPEKRGTAFATFEDRIAAPDQALGFDGPWAWFRMIDAAKPPSAQARHETELTTVLRFQTSHHHAQVTIEAPDARRNPFAAQDWRQFKCEP